MGSRRSEFLLSKDTAVGTLRRDIPSRPIPRIILHRAILSKVTSRAIRSSRECTAAPLSSISKTTAGQALPKDVSRRCAAAVSVISYFEDNQLNFGLLRKANFPEKSLYGSFSRYWRSVTSYQY